ncbi:MAG: DUF3343 domain-containing protein [Chitinispirillaceae bacterium]|jgi:hypothetical protein|nr:DUF3343 domain-containing protein [Chitinispirillaceae bacterium]
MLILFQSTHAVIKAERLCLAQGIPCAVIAVPRTISSECGIALELDPCREGAVTSILERADLMHKIFWNIP